MSKISSVVSDFPFFFFSSLKLFLSHFPLYVAIFVSFILLEWGKWNAIMGGEFLSCQSSIWLLLTVVIIVIIIVVVVIVVIIVVVVFIFISKLNIHCVCVCVCKLMLIIYLSVFSVLFLHMLYESQKGTVMGLWLLPLLLLYMCIVNTPLPFSIYWRNGQIFPSTAVSPYVCSFSDKYEVYVYIQEFSYTYWCMKADRQQYAKENDSSCAAYVQC